MRKQRSPIGFALLALGAGIITVCIFPTKFIIVFMAFALMLCGIMLVKKC